MGNPSANPVLEKLRKLDDKAERGVTYGFDQTIWRDAANEIERHAEKLRRMVEWLEANQPDVFSRGLWEAIK